MHYKFVFIFDGKYMCLYEEEKEEAAISQNSLVAFGAHRATEMVGWLGEETTESLALFRQGQSDSEAKCCL